LQTRHRNTARRAIAFGALATIVGLAALLGDPPIGMRWALLAFEAACFAVSAWAVARGLLQFRKEAWLTVRYKAEMYRLLIYQRLIDPGVWTRRKPGPEGWTEYLAEPLQRIARLPDDPRALAAAEGVPALVAPEECAGVDPADVRDLGRFYQETIVEDQIKYFSGPAGNEGWLLSSRLAPTVFVVAAVLVIVHLILELDALRSGSRFAETVGVALLTASILAVIVWAAVRTWLGANEFTRNAFRATARVNALEAYGTALDDALKVQRLTNSEPDAWRVFATLNLCQAMLESENREWLRLMVEAEWY
jgi:hypothetical protein